MLAVAFIWSISSNFDKIGVQNSSPVFWVVAGNVFVAAVMFPIMFTNRGRAYDIRRISLSCTYRLFSGIALVFQMTAVSLALVSYVISIKRRAQL